MHAAACATVMHHSIAVAVSLSLLLSVTAQVRPACVSTVDSSSPFLGAPYSPAWNLYRQQNAWAANGDITKLNIFFDKKRGCLVGLKATYGSQGSNARRLGLATVGDTAIPGAELMFEREEGVNMVEIKYDSCITYLSFTTNKGRDITVGDATSNGNLQILHPQAPAGYLGFINAYVDEVGATDTSIGELKQLQLVWAVKDCGPEAAAAATAADRLRLAGGVPIKPSSTGSGSGSGKRMGQVTAGSAAAAAAAEPGDGQEVVTEEVVATDAETDAEAVEAVPAPPAAAAATPTAAAVPATPPAAAAAAADTTTCKSSTACPNGVCPTSSCALNGMGKDVVTLSCFGTNLIPNKLLENTVGDPCANLACKLDKPNCKSMGLLGVGGFCTGQVVAMGIAAKLHPIGKSFVGYPCMERKGVLVNMMPFGDYSAQGTYVAKAWKVCDCINNFSIHQGSLAFQATVPDFSPSLTLPSVNRSISGMTMPDIVGQWVAAALGDVKIPVLSIGNQQQQEIKITIPGFTMPSIVIPRMSAPLFRVPRNISLPVFTVPNRSLERLVKLMPNITSLPTFMVPRTQQRPVPKIRVFQVTVPNLPDLAGAFNIPFLPKFKPIFKLSFPDVVAQWAAAGRSNMQLPRLHLENDTIEAVSLLVPGFKVPSMVVADISSQMLKLPSPFQFPLFKLPDGDSLKAIAALMPKLTALPTMALPEVTIKVPQLTLPDVTVPGFDEIVSAVTEQDKKLKEVQGLMRVFNLTMPQLKAMNIEIPDFKIDLPNFPHIRLPDLTPELPSEVSINLPDISKIDLNPLDDIHLNLSAVQNIASAVGQQISNIQHAFPTMDGLDVNAEQDGIQVAVPAINKMLGQLFAGAAANDAAASSSSSIGRSSPDWLTPEQVGLVLPAMHKWKDIVANISSSGSGSSSEVEVQPVAASAAPAAAQNDTKASSPPAAAATISPAPPAAAANTAAAATGSDAAAAAESEDVVVTEAPEATAAPAAAAAAAPQPAGSSTPNTEVFAFIPTGSQV